MGDYCHLSEISKREGAWTN